MIKKMQLKAHHIEVLQAIKRLQPCGSTAVATAVCKREDVIYDIIFYKLARQGYVETEVVRWIDKKEGVYRAKVIPGTIRLTKQGEEMLRVSNVP